MGSCPQAGGVYREGFELGLKGEEDITQLHRDEPRHGMPGLWVRLIAQLKCIYIKPIAWAINRRSWKPLWSRTAMT